MSMPVLPIPMIVSLVLFALLAQRLVRRDTHMTLLALIATCAVQAAVIALVQYYGVVHLRWVQPVLATFIPPIAWFAFERASGGYGLSKVTALHAIVPALALLLLLVNPMLLDILIPATFTGYGISMLLQLRSGEDSLPHSRLESGSTSLMAWRVVALALIASAGCDVLIAVGLARGHGGELGWIPSLVSSLSLVSLGVLSLTNAIESRREPAETETTPTPEELERDQVIVSRLDDYVKLHKPFLDPDLTLARMSRKLVIPAKQLSAAINRVKGENVSRYINRQRIEHACRLLEQGQSVTTAMLDSGFNTKSNFNREFLRTKKMPPRDWLAIGLGGLQSDVSNSISVIHKITESRLHD